MKEIMRECEKYDKIKFMQEKDICVQRRTTGEKNVPENDDWWPGQYVRDRSEGNCLSRYWTTTTTTTTGIWKKKIMPADLEQIFS